MDGDGYRGKDTRPHTQSLYVTFFIGHKVHTSQSLYLTKFISDEVYT